MSSETSPSGEGHLPTAAMQIFEAWLAEQEQGSDAEIEALCAAHPANAGDLRQLHSIWQSVCAQLPRARPHSTLSVSELLGGAAGPEPMIALDPDASEVPNTRELMRRLLERRPGGQRYVEREEVARGGMGVIYRIWDHDLHRHLAKKVVHDGHSARSASADARRLGRFLEEAQITSQLDHPGIVPVHDLGLDDSGRVYFTMPLIRGQSLQDVFTAYTAGDGEWTLARCLNVLIKVCEALAYAHARRVVHRDVKPDNVMVGRFGETYIMDWGLARIIEEVDPHDLRPAPSASVIIETQRSAERETDPESPLMTMDGQVIGTPSYMAPEQAVGAIGSVGPRADIYAVGAMLYQLLAGHPPYATRQSTPSPRDLLRMVMAASPRPLSEVDPTLPRALVAICEKAMHRDPGERYDDALAMARDLEAFLDDRPTEAGRPGQLEVVLLALRRNRAVAATATVGVVVVIVLLVVSLVRARDQAERRQRMLDFMAAQALLEQVDEVHVIHPKYVAGIERWLGRADDLLSREAVYSQEESANAETAPPTGDERRAMLANMESVRERAVPLRNDVHTAQELGRRSIDEHRGAWDAAIADIATLEVYGGLRIAPQLGLAPLRRDPVSGLWEFWVVASGSKPEFVAGEIGYKLTRDTGLVVVLLPGGEFTIGSPEGESSRLESERQQLRRLTPFFLGKHEVPQGVWRRVMGDNPAQEHAGLRQLVGGYLYTWMHPVETVSWTECDAFSRRLGLALPTEAQWEYGCRAGTTTAYFRGDGPRALRGRENVRDRKAAGPEDKLAVPWDDGWEVHAPVGSYLPNAFGLYDTQGNVSEWCRDIFDRSYGPPSAEPGDGLQDAAEGRSHSLRGGHYYMEYRWCRSAFRQYQHPELRSPTIGCRVARPVEPMGG